jgi:predicted transposase YbfD/YdcC
MEKHKDLISLFGDIPDPRINRKKLHQLGDIMAIAILAVICGAETWVDIQDFGVARHDWLKKFLDLSNGIPSHDTFNRVFSLLDPKEFEKRFVEWVEAISGKLSGQVVIDGKMIKGSGNRRNKKEPLWVVSAWSAELDLVLAHTQVSEKSNEITAIPELLEMLSIEGCVVSLDAMGCQKEIAKKICDEGGDYVLALKGNQGNLHAEIINYFEQAKAQNFEYVEHDFHKSYEENRGRKEERLLYVTGDIEWLPKKDEWRNLKSIICLTSNREVKQKKTTETRYYISSLCADAQEHAKAVRNHWGIENKQHWILDVGFNEDKSQIRDKISGKNFATLRRLALNLLKQEPTKAGMKRKRLKAGWDEKYLRKVLG